MKVSRILPPLCAVLALASAPVADAGVNSWTLHGPQGGGGSVQTLATHPTNGSILLATPTGIFRSTDQGDTWTPTGIDGQGSITSLAFDPTNPNHVVANDGRLHLSEDGGLTFAIAQGPTALNTVYQIAYAPNGLLYVAISGGRAFKSRAPFSSWTELSSPWAANSTTPTFLTVDRVDPDIVYIGMYEQGIFRSTDGGMTWTSRVNGFPHLATTWFSGLDISPTNPARLLTATNEGIWRSIDSGATWTQQDAQFAGRVVFDPANANNAYAIDNYQLRRSVNGGDSWSSIVALRSQWVSEIDFIPGVAGGLLLGSSSGVLRSHNGGTSFEFLTSGLTGTSPRDIAASDDGSVFTAINAGNYDLFERQGNGYRPFDHVPLLARLTYQRQITTIAVAAGDSDQVFAVNAGSDLIRTFDRGATWSAPHAAFSSAFGDYVTDVQIAPSHANVAYVGRYVTGLWKTENFGGTFSRLTTSPTFVGAIGVSPHDNDTLYIGGGTTSATGIYKSTNRGATWTEQLAPQGNSTNHNFTSFSFHPTDPDIVYGAAWSGVYRTTNGGVDWSLVDFGALAGGTYTYASTVMFDPIIPTTLTMVGPSIRPGFMRSVDGGQTWDLTGIPVNGPQVSLTGAVLDPHDSAVIIAMTNSSDIAEYRVAPDLTLSMSSLGALAVSGSTSVTYTVRNNGPHASSASELVITAPSWVTPSGAGCTRAGQTLTCRHGVLRVNESHEFRVDLAVALAGGNGQISATLTGHERDLNTADNVLTQNVSAAELADVDVTITGTQVIDRGESTNVTVSVSNSGPSPSTATTVVLQLPANASMTDLAWSRGNCQTGALMWVSCTVGTLAMGDSMTLNFVLTGEVVGQGTLTAEVDGAGTDTDGISTASRTFTIRPLSDMRIALAESADPVTVDAGFQYIATVTNHGPDVDAFQVSIPVTGAVVLDATSTVGSCTVAANTATCASTGIASGASGTITLNLNSAVLGIATGTATLSVANRDPDTSNNSASIGTTLRLVGDVSVEIADSADPANVGAAFNYVVTTRNAGPNASAVQVVIPVTNATVNGVTSAGAACTSTTTSVTCDIGSLASGGSNVISITVAAAAAGTASATATATYAGVDSNTANNSATANTVVRLLGDLNVTVTDSVDPATTGVAYSYSVTVQNGGPHAGAVSVAVPVTGASVTSATMNGGTCTTTATSVNCNVASLASSTSAVLTINVSASTAGTASAAATATFSGTDPDVTNNTATANTVVNAPPAPAAPRRSGGGGGRLDWLFVALLGGLLARRATRVR